MAIRATLRDAGVALPLKFVTDGSSAIAYLNGSGEYRDREKFPLPSVLLLDLKMPRLDGFQVMEWLKTQKRFNDLLIVVVSGNGDLSNIPKAYSLGARSFLMKPIRVADIQNLMRSHSTHWGTDSTAGTTGKPRKPPIPRTGRSVSPAKNPWLHL